MVYGYFPVQSKGDDLILYGEDGGERYRFTFPRQRYGRHPFGQSLLEAM